MATITLKPSILVVFTTQTLGGVETKREKEKEKREGVKVTTVTRSTRIVEDEEECARAAAVRAALHRRIARVCTKTVLGAICPVEAQDDLDLALLDCERMVREFNDSSKIMRMTCVGVQFNIISDNLRATQAVLQELQATMGDLLESIKGADIDKTRALAKKLKGIEAAPPEEVAEQFSSAVAAARKAANTLSREVTKKEREVEEVLGEIDLLPIESAQAFFLEAESKVCAEMQVEDADAEAAAAGLEVM